MKEKIYITALHMGHGGVEMCISLLSNALIRQGYEVEILSIYNMGEPVYELNSKVKISYLTNVRPNREEFLKAKKEHSVFKLLKESLYAIKVLYLKDKSIKDAFKNINEGIVISTRNEHSIALSKYGKKQVYKIAQLHHDHAFEKKYVEAFKRKYQNIDKFVLLTEELKSEVEAMMKGNNQKTECVVIPNFLENVKQDVKDDLKEKTVITVGRLHPVKGFERLIDIWEKIAAKNKEWKLKIIGGGELEETLRKKIDDRNLNSSIKLMGQMEHDDVMEEMKKASMYVMTSYSEAFPFVLIEAMACGLPVVAFDVRVGPRAIIEDGKEGFLIEDGNENDFLKNTIYLMENKKERVVMSKNAINKAQRFSEDEVIKKWLLLLKKE